MEIGPIIAIAAFALILGFVAKKRTEGPALRPDEHHDHESSSANERLARLLISEIVLYNEEFVAKAKKEKIIVPELQEELRRARGMYDERLPEEERGDAFDQAVVEMIGDGDPAILASL